MTRPHSYTVTVDEVIQETHDSISLVVVPSADAGSHFDYKPGQFLTLQIPTERSEGCARCYSLASAPTVDDKMKVTIKRTKDGYGSNWLCDNISAGDTIEVLPPAGTFVPRSLTEDVLLWAGGSGITPVMSIAKSVLSEGNANVVLIYANRDEDSVIFADELKRLEARYDGQFNVVHWLESDKGIPTVDALAEIAAPYATRPSYICGPEAYMDAVRDACAQAGVDTGRIHLEKFTSLDNDPFAEQDIALDESGDTIDVEVTLDGETTTVKWPKANYLLDVLLKEGLEAPFSCREGNCSACACVVLEGEVSMDRNTVLEEADLEDGIVLSCQARAVTDTLKVSFDE